MPNFEHHIAIWIKQKIFRNHFVIPLKEIDKEWKNSQIWREISVYKVLLTSGPTRDAEWAYLKVLYHIPKCHYLSIQEPSSNQILLTDISDHLSIICLSEPQAIINKIWISREFLLSAVTTQSRAKAENSNFRLWAHEVN